MKTSVEKLFDQLKCSDEATQNNAVAQLWMLLEQGIYPERQDKTWELVLSDDLLGLRLSTEEIKEIVDSAIVVVESKQIYRSAEMSLIRIIALGADNKNAEILFQFFSDLASAFNEQEAFSFIAGLTQFCLRVGDTRQITPFILKYNTIELLKGFQNTSSERLQESATRMLNYLNSEGIMLRHL